ILPPVGNPTRNAIDRMFRELTIEPAVVAEANSLIPLLALVEAGLGGAILPWTGVGPRALHRPGIPRPAPVLPASLSHPSPLPQSEAANAILALITTVGLERVRLPDWIGATVETPP